MGGGTAGLVLANRLSSNPALSIAVVEAGSFAEISNGNLSQIPRNAWNSADITLDGVNPLIDWSFVTEPEAGIGGTKIHYPRGRTLGGSSSRNHMVYQRGTAGSYKKWADEVGDKGYEWENWKKYFDRSTTFHAADATKRLANSTPEVDPAGARATDGPVSIAYTNYILPFSGWVLKATEALGMKKIAGFIDGVLIGSSWNMMALDAKTQTRESAETAYLRPALKRSNLIIYHFTTAMKVLFDGKEAVGILCNTLGKEYTLTARKEVVLSAGAFQSPQLLMVSGIGPKETLQKFNIPVLVDAPGVGKGLEVSCSGSWPKVKAESLQDHPAIGVTYKVKVESSAVLDSPAKNDAAVRDFLSKATGPLASTSIDVIAWEKIPSRLLSNRTSADLANSPSDWPDLEYITSGIFPGIPPDGGEYASIMFVMVNTFSRGTVSISSASMLNQPVINIAFLTDARDQVIAIAAVRRLREIFAHFSLAPVLVGPEVAPGNGTVTDTQILQYIQAAARTISHASCTCKMGKKDNKLAVVDSKGKVFGVQRLRVVDASAIPFLPPGHPMSTVYALAEKIADDILE